MFNNPLNKYQQGGKATPEQEQQITQLFEAASKNTGVDIETLMTAANQMPDEASIKQYVEAISKAASGDQTAIASIKKMFSKRPTMKKSGGKIQDFICKHAHGRKIVGCGCMDDGWKVEKARDGIPNLNGRFKSNIRKPDTAQADTTGTISNQSVTSRFRFNPEGRRVDVYANGNMSPTTIFVDRNWVNNNPNKVLWWGLTGKNAKIGSDEMFNSIAERVPAQEQGGVVKGQGGTGKKVTKAIGKAAKTVKSAKTANRAEEIAKVVDYQKSYRIPKSSVLDVDNFVKPSKLDYDIDKFINNNTNIIDNFTPEFLGSFDPNSFIKPLGTTDKFKIWLNGKYAPVSEADWAKYKLGAGIGAAAGAIGGALLERNNKESKPKTYRVPNFEKINK